MRFAAVTRAFSKQIMNLKQSSPTLMFVVGIAAVGTGTVLACRATLKVEPVIDRAQNELNDINSVETSTRQDKMQDRVYVYTGLALELGRLYGPAVIIGAAGVACLTGSHTILTRRNAALTAAYAAVERSYKAYRSRVREEIGEDEERKLHYSVQHGLHEEDRKFLEKYDGNGKKLKRRPGGSIYSQFFDETNRNWTHSPQANLVFIRCQQDFANDMLRAKGYVMLNDVYDMLGIPRTTAGAVVGWVYRGGGDDFIDFGIFNGESDATRAFVNGYERNVLLDFNVDGEVYQELDRLRWRV